MTRACRIGACGAGLLWVCLHTMPVKGEEAGRPEPRSYPSIFSADLSPIPSSIDEMLPAPPARAGEGRTADRQFPSRAFIGQMTTEIEDAQSAQLYRRLSARGDIFVQERKADSAFGRAIDTIFTPEPIRLGGTQIAFSPITAIKRRNPLCLLNPLVFNVSW